MQYDCQNGKRTSRDLALPPMIVLKYLQIAVSQITASSIQSIQNSSLNNILDDCTRVQCISICITQTCTRFIWCFALALAFVYAVSPRSLYLRGDHLIWSAFDIGPCKTWMYIRTTMDIRPMSFETVVLSTAHVSDCACACAWRESEQKLVPTFEMRLMRIYILNIIWNNAKYENKFIYAFVHFVLKHTLHPFFILSFYFACICVWSLVFVSHFKWCGLVYW